APGAGVAWSDSVPGRELDVEDEAMRITRCATAVVEANYDYTYVRIHADNGVYGTEECFFAAGLTAALRGMFPLLIGRDPCEVDRLARLLWRHRSGAGAVARYGGRPAPRGSAPP